MATYLFKTEPGAYSFEDLVEEKSCRWDGVSNPGALAALRKCRKGDEVLVYHTGDQKAVVGLAQVTAAAYEDPGQPGKTAEGGPKFAVVDLKPLRRAGTPVSLAQIKKDPRFAAFALLKQSRLSVMEVPPKLDAVLRKLAGF